MTTQTEFQTFNPMQLATAPDIHERFAELRASGPSVQGALPLLWGITRHADVSALLRDRRLGHAFPRPYVEFVQGTGPSSELVQNILLNTDPPEHTRLRALTSRAFGGLVVRKLGGQIAELVDALIDLLLERETFDVVDDLAFPLPVQVICELLGVRNDADLVRPYVVDLLTFDNAKADAAAVWMRDYIGALLAERRPDADGDLLERMLAAEDGDDALTHTEIVDNVILLYIAGFETTSNLIANGIAALFEHPEQQRLLWSDPSLAPLAVEEFLRYDTPVIWVNRYSLEPFDVGDVTIPAEQWVMLFLASANRDETVFTDAGRLDITRKPNPHVGFGGGIHHCMGAMLARLEGEIAFSRMVARFGSIEPAGEPTRREMVRGLAHLPAAAR